MGPIVIETERLRLREWTAEDAEPFAAISSDPEVVRYITGGRPLTLAETRSQIERLIFLQEQKGWTRWALELREPVPGDPTGPVGFCGPGCTFAPDIEVGWWLHSALWGRGLATEAAVGAVQFCFETIGFLRLICCVHPDNDRSLAVARKAGFTRLDEVDFHGTPIIRHEQNNPRPGSSVDSRFARNCDGMPSGPVPRADD